MKHSNYSRFPKQQSKRSYDNQAHLDTVPLYNLILNSSTVDFDFGNVLKHIDRKLDQLRRQKHTIFIDPNLNHLQKSEKQKKLSEEINSYQKQQEIASALILRIKRFRLRFYVLLFINNKLTNENEAINIKLKEITNHLKQKKLNVAFGKKLFPNMQNDQPNNIISANKFVIRELSQPSKTLTDMLPVLIALLGFNPLDPIPPSVEAALVNIAPPYFKGVEKDYFYLIPMLTRIPDPAVNTYIKLFNEEQLKQWKTYYNEIFHLYKFLSYGPAPVDLRLITENMKYTSINIPLKEFFQLTSCSNKTFSKIITALNIYTAFLWQTISHRFQRLVNPDVAPNNNPFES